MSLLNSFCRIRLIDMYARTLAATFVDKQAHGGPCTRIASYLTPSSTLYVVDTQAKKIVLTNYMPYQDSDAIDAIPEPLLPVTFTQPSSEPLQLDTQGRLVLQEEPYRVPHFMQDHDGSLLVPIIIKIHE